MVQARQSCPWAGWPMQWLMMLAACGCVLLTTASAASATWIGPRTTPRLRELVALDATGEPGWPYGLEDVAGDGSAIFQAPEQAMDFRSAYAATDNSRFWFRAYVSSANAVGANVTLFVFIDADANGATGGSAAATAVNALFTTDPTQGGYEYVMAVHANGTVTGLWRWRDPQQTFETVQVTPANTQAEADRDFDPILVTGPQHGYVQGNVDLNVVGLTSACGANLFFRSVNEGAGEPTGDLDLGQVNSCVPRDQNGDGVPDVIVPPTGCTSDAQCPAGGVCVQGSCVLPRPCIDDTNCAADQQCTPDGRCVPRPTGACTTNAQCTDMVCVAGQCVACTPSGAECGAGYECAPTGRCVPGGGPGPAPDAGGPLINPNDNVQGGACHCRAGSRAASANWLWLMLVGAAAALARRAGARSSRSHH